MKNSTSNLKDCLEDFDSSSYSVPIVVGKDKESNCLYKDLKEIQSILIAGHSGSGKSQFLHSVVNTIMLKTRPEKVEFVLIDTKKLEFDIYKDSPALRIPVINDSKKARIILKELEIESVRRHRILRYKGELLSIEDYNQKFKERLPYIVILIDDISDLVKERYGSYIIESVLALGRSVGVYMLFSANKCTEDVVTERMKLFSNAWLLGELTKEELEYLFEEKEAEKPKGKGNMFFTTGRKKEIVRVDTPSINKDEISDIVKKTVESYPKRVDREVYSEGYFRWLSERQIQNLVKEPEKSKIKLPKGIKLMPTLAYNLPKTYDLTIYFIRGILKSYDLSEEEVKEVERKYGVNVKDQEKYYLDFLLDQFKKPNDFYLENAIVSTLIELTDRTSINHTINLLRNSVKLFPSSYIIENYITYELEYLYNNPKERKKEIYKKLRELIKQIKKEKVTEERWDTLLMEDYCLADLLGEGVDKEEYLKKIKNEDTKRAIRERSSYDILFGEEFV
jgi:energy-coupling factor transporter ATP-binding protein EcfA2